MRSDSINSNSSEYGEYRRKVVDLRDATYNVEATESGTIFTINKADGIDIVLPTAEAGLEYEFHIGTTCTGDALTITADSSSDTYQGAVAMHDKDHLGSVVALNEDIDTDGWNFPAAADYI